MKLRNDGEDNARGGCDIPSFQDPIEPSRWMFWHTGTPERTLMKRDIQRPDAWRTTSVANVATISLPHLLIPFPSSRCSSFPLATSSARTFERPFAPWLHVWLSLPKKPLMCDQLIARYFLPVTNVLQTQKKGKRNILDRKKTCVNSFFFLLSLTTIVTC